MKELMVLIAGPLNSKCCDVFLAELNVESGESASVRRTFQRARAAFMCAYSDELGKGFMVPTQWYLQAPDEGCNYPSPRPETVTPTNCIFHGVRFVAVYSKQEVKSVHDQVAFFSSVPRYF